MLLMTRILHHSSCRTSLIVTLGSCVAGAMQDLHRRQYDPALGGVRRLLHCIGTKGYSMMAQQGGKMSRMGEVRCASTVSEGV